MVDIKSRQSITAVAVLAVMGPCVFILQPDYALGPWVAAQMLDVGGFDAVNFHVVVIFFAAALFLVPGVLSQRATGRTTH